MNLDDDSSSEAETVNGLFWDYPEQFKGEFGENVHDFIEKIETAFSYNRVPTFNKVNVLKKLVKGNVETSVSVWLSLDENLDYLRKVYRNPCNLEKRKG